MKYIFIVNPIAGNDNKARVFARIKSTFRKLDDEMIIEETRRPGDAKGIAEKYSQLYGDNCVIVSCGGDGTVHEIANGIANTDTPLMVLPLGTGNDFAKKIYETKDINVENVIKSFGFYNGNICYDVRPIDLIACNDQMCINVMCFGLDTKVAITGKKIAQKNEFLGHQAYKIAIVPTIFGNMKYKMNVQLNCIDKKTGEHFTINRTPCEYTLMAICNGSFYGGGFCPAPNAVLDDGLMDLALCAPLTFAKALPLIPKYSAGEVDKIKELECAYVTSGSFTSADGNALLGNCDGELFDYKQIDFKVLPKAIKICFIKE